MIIDFNEKTEYRSVKVYDVSGKSQIRLEGKWLEEAGFNKHDKLDVQYKNGMIVITKSNELLIR